MSEKINPLMPNPHRVRSIEAKQRQIKSCQGWTPAEIRCAIIGGIEVAAGAAVMVFSGGIGTLLGGGTLVVHGNIVGADALKHHKGREKCAEQLKNDIENMRK